MSKHEYMIINGELYHSEMQHGIVQKAGEALRKLYGTLTSMSRAPLYFWNVPNKIKANDGTGGYWILQSKKWHSGKIGVTATYKHSKTGAIETEEYEVVRTKDKNSANPFKYKESNRYKFIDK